MAINSDTDINLALLQLGKNENFIGQDPITSQDGYYTKKRKEKTAEFNKLIQDFDKKRLQMKPLKMSYGMKNNK